MEFASSSIVYMSSSGDKGLKKPMFMHLVVIWQPLAFSMNRSKIRTRGRKSDVLRKGQFSDGAPNCADLYTGAPVCVVLQSKSNYMFCSFWLSYNFLILPILVIFPLILPITQSFHHPSYFCVHILSTLSHSVVTA